MHCSGGIVHDPSMHVISKKEKSVIFHQITITCSLQVSREEEKSII